MLRVICTNLMFKVNITGTENASRFVIAHVNVVRLRFFERNRCLVT
jgi:hypothetical protein